MTRPLHVLWVKVGGLWPPNVGGRIRSFNVLREIARSNRVTVLTTHAPGEDPNALAAHLPERSRVLSFPHRPVRVGSWRFAAALARSSLGQTPVDLARWRIGALASEVAWILGRGGVDVCVADFLQGALHVPLEGAVPVVHFSHNVEHLLWRRLAEAEGRPWRRALLELEWRKMRRFEAKVCSRADLSIAVSELDRDRLRAIAGTERVQVVPTGVDTEFFRPLPCDERPASMVFLGAMDWYPNEDGVLGFLAETLPLIRREIPEAALTVVGRAPSEALRRAAAAAGATVTGEVADVRPHVAEASVFVVPLRVGGGTRLKIFEAMAMGKAVVSTPVGAEGLPLVPGEHYLAAETPAEFARAVVALLRDPQRRRAMGEAGRKLVEERYAWQTVAKRFEELCWEAVDHASERVRHRVRGHGDGSLPGESRA